MSDKIDYGKLTKKIVFTDSDHRHAQLVLRLKHDGLTQSGFFRHMITAYIEGDERVQELVSEFSNQSKTRTSKSRKLHSQGRKKISKVQEEIVVSALEKSTMNLSYQFKAKYRSKWQREQPMLFEAQAEKQE